MPAPFKSGLDYFPHDVDMSTDPQVEYIEAIHGIIGYAIYNKLLEKIYHNGYYIKWEDRDLAIFAKKLNLDRESCINVVNDCINEGLFNQKLYRKHNILTSSGIQKRYLKCCERRKRVVLIKEFLLLELKTVNSIIKEDNVSINSINTDINSQIEIENEIENETRDDDIPFVEIISYLNKKADKNFRASAESNKKHIRTRWHEGNRLDGFYYVIDIKTPQWKDTDNDKYLRPETLFGPKFESYRNEKPMPAKSTSSAPHSNNGLHQQYQQARQAAYDNFKSTLNLDELRSKFHDDWLSKDPGYTKLYTDWEDRLEPHFQHKLAYYIEGEVDFPSFEQWKARFP